MRYLLILTILLLIPWTGWAQALIDPTQPSIWLDSPELEEEMAIEEDEEAQLQGIFSTASGSSAMINGRRYYVGDELPFGEVISISDKKVVVRTNEGERKELMVSLPVVKSRAMAAEGEQR